MAMVVLSFKLPRSVMTHKTKTMRGKAAKSSLPAEGRFSERALNSKEK
jgi:hypothetical protein